MRNIRVAAAQLGPIQKDDRRQVVVRRMVDLMDRAKAESVDLIVYPELALTTFFPRWYHKDRAEADIWFEREVPSAATQPLFERAAEHRIAPVSAMLRVVSCRAFVPGPLSWRSRVWWFGSGLRRARRRSPR